jgi:hypothetical protein
MADKEVMLKITGYLFWLFSRAIFGQKQLGIQIDPPPPCPRKVSSTGPLLK